MRPTPPNHIEQLQALLRNARYDASHDHYSIAMDEQTRQQFKQVAAATGMAGAFIDNQYAMDHLVLESAQRDYALSHLENALHAIETYQTIPGAPAGPVFKYFGNGTAASAGATAGNTPGHRKLAKLLLDTHMLALAEATGSPDNHIYATLCYRGTVLNAMELLRPDIVADVRIKMQELGIDPDEHGEIPMTPAQIDSFCESYHKVVDTLRTGDSLRAVRELETISRHAKIRVRPPKVSKAVAPQAPRSPDVKRGPEDRVMMSRQSPEESINRFMFPLEVLEPIRDTLKRIQHAQEPNNDGTHERMRPNAKPPECWVGYDDRSKLVARGRQLEQLLTIYPHLSDHRIQCVTIYPTRDGGTHTERQNLADAAQSPLFDDDDLRKKVILHRPEYWLAIPTELLYSLKSENDELHDLTTGAKTRFTNALTQTGAEREKGMAAADSELQAILDLYAERKVLDGKHSVNELRREHDTQLQI